MNTTKTTRRGILAAIPVMAAAMTPAAATALSDVPTSMAADPIFAALAEHKAAVAAREVVLDTYEDDAPERDAALDREEAAHTALFTIVPTTTAGAAAWLHRVGSPEYEGEEGCMVTVEFGDEFQNVIARQMRAVAAVLAGAQS
jgi:hypothetical protein